MIILKFIPFISYVINSYIWILIYKKRRKDPINNNFLIFAGSVSLWAIIDFITYMDIPAEWVIPLLKFNSIFWIPTGFLLLNFTYTFIKKKKRIIFLLFFIASVSLCLISLFTPFIIKGYINMAWGKLLILADIGMPVIYAIIIIPILYSVFLFLKELFIISDKKNKKILKYLIQGTVISVIVGFGTRLLNEVLSIEWFPDLSSSSSVILSIHVYVAVIMYNFLTISLHDASKNIFKNIHDAVVILDQNNQIIQINRAMKELFHISILDINSIDMKKLIKNFNVKKKYRNFETEIEIHNKRKVLLLSRSAIEESGLKYGSIIIIRDITDQKKAQHILKTSHKKLEEQVKERTKELIKANDILIKEINERNKIEEKLKISEERFKLLFEYAPVGYYLNDFKGIFVDGNMATEEITGYKKKELIGKSFLKLNLLPVKFLPKAATLLARNFLGESTGPDEFILNRKDGKQVFIEITTHPIRIQGKQLVLGIARDISGRKKAEYKSMHDLLTGLINKREFEKNIQALITDAHKYERRHSLVYIDLDQFKIINDTCGWHAGDEFLKKVTTIIAGVIRSSDVLARLGSDEFGILLVNCHISKALLIAENMCKAIRSFRFYWEKNSYAISSSIGIAEINKNTEKKTNILSLAEQACITAKEKGRNRVCLYKLDDEDIIKRQNEKNFVPLIIKALETHKFILYYQSIIPVSSEKIIPGSSEKIIPVSPVKTESCYEILIRMVNKDGRILNPGLFLPAAERYNLMTAIDRYVIETYFTYYNQLNNSKTVNTPSKVSINLSGASLNDDTFLDYIVNQIKKYNIPTHVLCFEITETIAITNLSRAIKYISEIKALGCSISLDDFGSGLSSFGYLKNLKVDYLKIDGCFVKDIDKNTKDFTMVRAINEMAHAMGIMTIAEFVENKTILNKLKEIGVDYAQGYYIAKPRQLE